MLNSIKDVFTKMYNIVVKPLSIVLLVFSFSELILNLLVGNFAAEFILIILIFIQLEFLKLIFNI